MTRALLFVWVSLLALLATASEAFAQSGAATAEALFREGKLLVEKGDYAKACPTLERSHELDPAVGTLALLAYCHERQGKLASAWNEYLAAAALARDARQDDRERVAREKAAELEQRLSKLKLVVKHPLDGLEVRRAGRAVTQAEWGVAVPIDPGIVEIEVTAPGYRPWRKSIEVPESAAFLSLDVPALLPEAARAKPPPAPSKDARNDRPVAPPGERSSGARTLLTVTAFGIGALGIGVGTYFGLRAKGKNDDSKPFCDGDECSDRGLELRDEALSAATVSTVAFAVGLAATGAGLVLVLTRGDDGTRPKEAAVGVAPAERGAVVSGRVRF